MIKKHMVPEFVGQIIDIFEDFLEEKGVYLDNPERDENDGSAIIYGSDYGALQVDLEEMLKNWELI